MLLLPYIWMYMQVVDDKRLDGTSQWAASPPRLKSVRARACAETGDTEPFNRPTARQDIP